MGTVKALLGLLLVAVVVIIGIKIIPPYFSNYEFEDFIKNEALQSTYTTRSEDDIRESIIKRARDYDIQLTTRQVKVSRNGSNGSGSLFIEAEYSVPVDLPGYSTTLTFHPSSKNKGVF